MLDGLLERPAIATRYPFTRLKSLPKRASLREVGRWESHLDWLENILDPRPFTGHLTSTKVEQFAAEAYQLEAGDMLDIVDKGKRHTLLLCLLHHMQVRTRDQLTTMFLKRMRLLHNNARKRLRDIQDQHRELSETMVNAFADIVVHAEETEKAAAEEDERDALLGKQVRRLLQANGGATRLRDQCEMLQAYHNNNYLPLIRHFYRQHRAMLFRLTAQLQIRPATRSRTLLQALAFIHEHKQRRVPYLPADVSLAFASNRWQSLVREKVEGVMMYHRHHLEVCVFTHIAEGLRSGDLYAQAPRPTLTTAHNSCRGRNASPF